MEVTISWACGFISFHLCFTIVHKKKRPEVSAQQQSEQLKGRHAIRAKNN